MPSPSRGTIQQRLVRVSHSPASADRKGKCLFLPLPASCPSFHPSVTSFPLSLRLSSLDPSHPPPHYLCCKLFLCCLPTCQRLAKLCSRTWLCAWAHSFLCVISIFLPASFFISSPIQEGSKRASLYTNTCAQAHRCNIAAFVCMRGNEHTQMFT